MTPRPRLRLGTIDKGLEQPAPYVQIANDLRRAIAAGTYGPGDRLPSEAELTEHYRVARMTVRSAMNLLNQEGLAISMQGRGVFVQEHHQPPIRERTLADVVLTSTNAAALDRLMADLDLSRAAVINEALRLYTELHNHGLRPR